MKPSVAEIIAEARRDFLDHHRVQQEEINRLRGGIENALRVLKNVGGGCVPKAQAELEKVVR